MQTNVVGSSSPQSTPPRRLFVGGGYLAVMEHIVEALAERRGLMLVHGGQGVGKTTLLQAVGECLPEDYVWCHPARTPSTLAELYRALLPAGTETQVPDEGPVPAAVREALEQWLRQRAMKGTWTVLAIDDADRLPAELMPHLDALAGLEPMLQILLVAAQPGFLEKEPARGTGLVTRVRASVELPPLQRGDWAALASWWQESGDGLAVDADAIDALGSLTRGKPGRMLDVLTSAADLARQQWLQAISKECVQLAATEGRRGNEDRRSASDRRSDGARPLPSPVPPPPSRPNEPVLPAAAAAIPKITAGGPIIPERIVSAPGLEGRDHQDPFRESATTISIDSAELLPVLSAPHGIHAEWFRVLQVRVEDWIRTRGGGPRTIVVSGPRSGAGKTLVAANLALLWAHSSYQRILLVDGDLRRPQFHGLFEIPRRPGFADLLAGRCKVEDCAAYVSEVGLHVIPAGRPGNPRQLAEPERVARAFDAVRSEYDVIIVDSPPLSAMVDSRSLAAAADGLLVVLRAGQTRLDAVQRMLDTLPADNVIGAVLNGAERDADSAYAEYRGSTRSG